MFIAYLKKLFRLTYCVAPLFVHFRWLCKPKQKPHGLGQELIISLTSHPKRFSTLGLTLKCLLTQDIKPDRIILWVSAHETALIPDDILAFKKYGLEIRACNDFGPYNKIIHTLEAFPNAIIITADDDLFYPSNWISILLKHWNGDARQIVCHRAHNVVLGENGLPLPYHLWGKPIKGPRLSGAIFPLGVGGVLYPPGSLSNEVLDKELFMRLSPRADDIWLFWMGKRAGSMYKKTDCPFRILNWGGSQKEGLLHENFFGHANDTKIQAMIEHFGMPDLS